MKYNIFLFLVFYYPIILFSQQNQSIGNKGVKDGFGVLEYSNSEVYRGNFVNSKLDGYGEYFFKNNDVINSLLKRNLKQKLTLKPSNYVHSRG